MSYGVLVKEQIYEVACAAASFTTLQKIANFFGNTAWWPTTKAY